MAHHATMHTSNSALCNIHAGSWHDNVSVATKWSHGDFINGTEVLGRDPRYYSYLASSC